MLTGRLFTLLACLATATIGAPLDPPPEERKPYVVLLKPGLAERDVKGNFKFARSAVAPRSPMDSDGDGVEDEFWQTGGDYPTTPIRESGQYSAATPQRLSSVTDPTGIFTLEGYTGYTQDLTESEAAEVRRNPVVADLMLDEKRKLHVLMNVERLSNGDVRYAGEDTAPENKWKYHGLARISHEENNQNGYVYNNLGMGRGMYAYILDTGVRADHKEFRTEIRGRPGTSASRVIQGPNFSRSPRTVVDPHGTMMAGIIGGTKYGVLKDVNLVDVKISHEDGTVWLSSLLQGLSWARSDIVKNNRQAQSVVVVTYSVPANERREQVKNAFESLYHADINVIVSAGTGGKNALATYPGGSQKVITVGALNQDDTVMPNTNFGSVHVFAPGEKVFGPGIHGNPDKASLTVSDHSLAVGYVAGLALYLMQMEMYRIQEGGYKGKGGFKKPTDVGKRIIDWSTKQRIRNLPPDTPNRIAYNGGAEGRGGIGDELPSEAQQVPPTPADHVDPWRPFGLAPQDDPPSQ